MPLIVDLVRRFQTLVRHVLLALDPGELDADVIIFGHLPPNSFRCYAIRMRLILLAALPLSACASVTPHVTSATPAGGIVSSYGWQPNRALQVAEAYCVTQSRHARVSSQNDLQDKMSFDCV